MIYKQLSYLPIIFQVDEDIINNIPKFLQRNKLSFTNVLVISGKSYSYKFATRLAKDNKWGHYILNDNTFDDVDKLRNFCELQRNDLIIAIGGGKVLDTVKRVGYLTNINHLSVPTIISNDGLISPISVIRNERGKTESIPGMMPMGVVIDLTVIQTSPINYIRAAAGDILSNISATNDWVLAYKKGKDNLNDIGFHLSRSAANALIHFNNIDLTYKPFLRTVVQGQINSGISMSLAGSSRPCSGSEHLLSHAIDFLGLTKNVLHGIQVASISLFTLFLQKKLLAMHIEYAVSTGIPLNFLDLLTAGDAETLKMIYLKSKEMRPGRFTVLDMVSEKKFLDALKQFGESIYNRELFNNDSVES